MIYNNNNNTLKYFWLRHLSFLYFYHIVRHLQIRNRHWQFVKLNNSPLKLAAFIILVTDFAGKCFFSIFEKSIFHQYNFKAYQRALCMSHGDFDKLRILDIQCILNYHLWTMDSISALRTQWSRQICNYGARSHGSNYFWRTQ